MSYSTEAKKFFETFPSQFWSLETYIACVIFSDGQAGENKDELYNSFYSALREVAEKNTSQQVRRDANTLLDAKKKRVS